MNTGIAIRKCNNSKIKIPNNLREISVVCDEYVILCCNELFPFPINGKLVNTGKLVNASIAIQKCILNILRESIVVCHEYVILCCNDIFPFPINTKLLNTGIAIQKCNNSKIKILNVLRESITKQEKYVEQNSKESTTKTSITQHPPTPTKKHAT